MAKGKAEDQTTEDQKTEVRDQPEVVAVPSAGSGTEVTVVAVERVFRRAENRYVEPGEEVALEPETAALLVELGVVVAASTGSAEG